MIDMETILWASIEDYAALYEAAWELNTIHPELGLAPSTRRAKWVVDTLVDHGFVELYWCREPYGDIWPVQTQEIFEALDPERNWIPVPCGEVGVRISATEKGQRLYGQFYERNRNQISDDDSLINELLGK